MSEFYRQKLERTLWYYKFEFGRKKRPCTACNGSGNYDSFNSPSCGACDGTKEEDYQTDKSKIMFNFASSIREAFPELFKQKQYEQILKEIENYHQSQVDRNWAPDH